MGKAGKVELKESNMAPKFVRSALVKVSAISLAKDSGWRPLDSARVQEIYTDLLLGPAKCSFSFLNTRWHT